MFVPHVLFRALGPSRLSRKNKSINHKYYTGTYPHSVFPKNKHQYYLCTVDDVTNNEHALRVRLSFVIARELERLHRQYFASQKSPSEAHQTSDPEMFHTKFDLNIDEG